MTIKFQGKHKSGYVVDVAQPFTFPAGEAHLKGVEDLKPEDYEYFIVDVRGQDPQDLFHLALFTHSLDKLSTTIDELNKTIFMGNVPSVYLLLPYLPAARSDRGVPEGAVVYGDFINTIVVPDVVIGIDPHSPRITEIIEDFHEYPFERIIKDRIAHSKGDELNVDHPYVGVIAPDSGAKDRAQRAADVLHVPVYTAGKTRDFDTGKLTGFHMEDPLPQTGKYLLVDDICDGGGTFVGLAEAIRETNPKVELDLWVTHGIFSKGTSGLFPSFGTVYTTNSFYGGDSWELPGLAKVVSFDITPYLYNEVAILHAGGDE